MSVTPLREWGPPFTCISSFNESGEINPISVNRRGGNINSDI
jgi:hypothetical protein